MFYDFYSLAVKVQNRRPDRSFTCFTTFTPLSLRFFPMTETLFGTLSDLDSKTIYPVQWGAWHLYKNRFLVHAPNGNPDGSNYDIDLFDINSHRDITKWLFHISGKSDWYEPENFFRAMSDVFRWAGEIKEINGKQSVEDYLRNRNADN